MTNENTQHDMDPRFDRLSHIDRSEPDAGFESRIAEGLDAGVPIRISGRKKKSTAWIPVAVAATVGFFAYISWPPSHQPKPMIDSQGIQAVAASTISADIWLTSFDTMDEMFASDDSSSDDLYLLEYQIDAAESEFNTQSDWYALGESL